MNEKISVLLVQNDSEQCRIMKRGLQLYGYDVVSYYRARDVLHSFTAHRFNIAILDVIMSRMNGFQLARRLWHMNAKLQVCFITPFEITSDEVRKVLPSWKSCCFLKKPIRPITLANHIISHLPCLQP